MLKEDIVFDYIDIEGNIKTYSIIDRFEKNSKNYIIYEEVDNDDIYAALYEIIDNKIKIIPISDDKDFDIVDDYLGAL